MPFKPNPDFDPYDRSGFVIRSCAECGKEFKLRSYHRYARCEKCRIGKKGRLKTRKPETSICPKCGALKHYNSKNCMACYKKALAKTAEENMPTAERIALEELVKREKARRKGMLQEHSSTQLKTHRDKARNEVKKKQVGYVAPPVVEKSIEEQLRELL